MSQAGLSYADALQEAQDKPMMLLTSLPVLLPKTVSHSQVQHSLLHF
jgi:hypothetical protein